MSKKKSSGSPLNPPRSDEGEGKSGVEYDDFDGQPDAHEDDEWPFDCGIGRDGQCSMAGSEDCDFECPLKTSMRSRVLSKDGASQSTGLPGESE